MKIILAAEDAILLYFSDKIEADLPQKIANANAQLKQTLGALIIDTIPAYTSLHIRYDLNQTSYQKFCTQVTQCLQKINNTHQRRAKMIQIPVCYDLDFGLDLERLLAEKQLDLKTFIKLHTLPEYQVYAIGFSPVFAFLGQVDERLQAPRLPTARLQVPAGSVAIAESQTAIYPTNSPGGWNIIGRTPLDLSLDNPDNLNKFKVGDKVKFIAISKNEF